MNHRKNMDVIIAECRRLLGEIEALKDEKAYLMYTIRELDDEKNTLEREIDNLRDDISRKEGEQ